MRNTAQHHEQNGVVWYTGPRGSGKTFYLVNSIVENLQRHEGRVLAIVPNTGVGRSLRRMILDRFGSKWLQRIQVIVYDSPEKLRGLKCDKVFLDEVAYEPEFENMVIEAMTNRSIPPGTTARAIGLTHEN